MRNRVTQERKGCSGTRFALVTGVLSIVGRRFISAAGLTRFPPSDAYSEIALILRG